MTVVWCQFAILKIVVSKHIVVDQFVILLYQDQQDINWVKITKK